MRELVAREGEATQGFVFFLAIGRAGLESGLFLKELSVAEAARGRGVGGRFGWTLWMDALIALARGEEYSRIDFTAADRPERTAFYARYGARRLEDRDFSVSALRDERSGRLRRHRGGAS